MKKRAEDSVNARKVIERLLPLREYGEIDGVLATSYEFQTDFVETDFLPTVFGLGAWDDRNWSTRIALERQLAATCGVTFMIDARSYRTRPRSLRIEVVPALGKNHQLLHAKVVLIVHSDAVRLTVGSHNLTKPGYRSNREVAVSIAATRKDPGAAALIRTAVERMPVALASWWTPTGDAVVNAARERLTAMSGDAADGGTEFVWSGHDDPLWRTFLSRWPTKERVQNVTIVSPFWSNDYNTGPLSTMLKALRERDLLAPKAAVTLLTEPEASSAGFIPKLPASYATLDCRTLGVVARAVAVDPRVSHDERTRDDLIAQRMLHAKVVVFEGERTTLAYAGSANFTEPGWGFARTANVEAGVISRATGRERHALRALVPGTAGSPVALDGAAVGRLAIAEVTADEQPWPEFLQSIRLARDAGHADRLVLEVAIRPQDEQGDWRLTQRDTPTSVLLTSSSHAREIRERARVALDADQLRILMREQEVSVEWWGSPTSRTFPINVEDSARGGLPISPEATKPGERELVDYYQGKLAWEDLFPAPAEERDADTTTPNTVEDVGVDTSNIQSYQVREFVEALRGLEEDLKNSCRSDGAIQLAVLGPVSPVALAREVASRVRERQRTETAGGFQLLEIIACLLRARAASVPTERAKQWKRCLDEAIDDVDRLLAEVRERPGANLTSRDFAAYEKLVRASGGGA